MKQAFGTVLLLALALALQGGRARAAVPPDDKAIYQQALAEAADAYQLARSRCDSLAGIQKDICVAEAKAVRVRVEQDATARYKDTLAAYTRARMRIAAANYDVERARCATRAGNEKDVCLGQAKANRIAAEADARADRKAFEAHADAREEKRTAMYKVALEKCDAFAGAARDNCIAAAKSEYGE